MFVNISKEAWTASWLASLSYIRNNLPWFYSFADSFRFDASIIRSLCPGRIDPSQESNNIQPASHEHTELVPPPEVSFLEVVSPLVAHPDRLPTQKELCKRQDSTRYQALLETLRQADPPEAAALLLSSSMPGIGSWLYSGCSSYEGFQVSDEEFKESIRLRLLLPVHQDPAPVDRRCRNCKSNHITPYHALACGMPSRQRIGRHDLIRDAVARFLRSSNPAALVAVEEFIPRPEDSVAPPNTPLKRADIRVTLNNVTQFIDIAITSPTSSTALNNGNSATVAGAAASAKEREKINKYANAYPGSSVADQLVPFVLESTGRLGPKALSFLDLWCARTAGFDPSPSVSQDLKSKVFFLKKRLAVLVVKGISRIVKASRSHVEVLRRH